MSEDARKVFISYSWAVQARVVELAERLVANGVDVILDVWDLKPGHDKYAFMEQSVNDPTVNKVLIICDKTYTEKADARLGGVGDETVIISPEIYGKVSQEKFIPIAFEVDENGKAYIPHYLKIRIYFALATEDDRYEIEYEKYCGISTICRSTENLHSGKSRNGWKTMRLICHPSGMSSSRYGDILVLSLPKLIFCFGMQLICLSRKRKSLFCLMTSR